MVATIGVSNKLIPVIYNNTSKKLIDKIIDITSMRSIKKEFKGSKVQRFKGSKVQRFGSSEVQKFGSSEGSEGWKVGKFRGS
ncbi:MAG TPA: hypothetical protein VHO70_23200 [Chitinispirillaceae bacterium]|nr:hypothetical protein [Chitinispirillaceae bacterium]